MRGIKEERQNLRLPIQEYRLYFFFILILPWRLFRGLTVRVYKQLSAEEKRACRNGEEKRAFCFAPACGGFAIIVLVACLDSFIETREELGKMFARHLSTQVTWLRRSAILKKSFLSTKVVSRNAKFVLTYKLLVYLYLCLDRM